MEKFLKELERGAEYDSELRLLASIVFSQLYTVIGNGLYYSTFNPSVAKDTIALAKHQLGIMSRMFEEKGYKVINIDVDNVFIQLDDSKGQSIEEILLIKDEIIKTLQSRMPFKSETFDLQLIYKLQYLRFTKKQSVEGNPDNFMNKGEYVYVTDNGQIGHKGLTIDIVEKMLEGVV